MTKKKSVWLINQYLCTPELNGDGHRHSYLAEEWIKKGYDVTLITSSFSHVPHRKNEFKGLYKVSSGKIRTLLIKGNKYNQKGLTRILSWLIFCFLLFFIPTKKIPKPDIIIVSSNSLLPILNVVFYFKKRFKKVKFILEIRDIWPLSLIELGGFSKNNLFVKFLALVEKLGYKKSDYIVSLLINTDKHIEKVLRRRNFKYSWVSNGFDLNNLDTQQSLPVSLANKLPKNKFIIGYTGSLGIANAMEYIIEAAKILEKENIALCIVGNGDEKNKLVQMAKGYDNIIFLGRIPKNQVLSFLYKCDLLYFSSKKIDLYKYGISANKTFDYMYSEKPIILSASTYNNVIEFANCGFIVPPEDINAIVEKVRELNNINVNEIIEMGKRGKKYLLDNFTYQKLANDYTLIFESLYE